MQNDSLSGDDVLEHLAGLRCSRKTRQVMAGVSALRVVQFAAILACVGLAVAAAAVESATAELLLCSLAGGAACRDLPDVRGGQEVDELRVAAAGPWLRPVRRRFPHARVKLPTHDGDLASPQVASAPSDPASRSANGLVHLRRSPAATGSARHLSLVADESRSGSPTCASCGKTATASATRMSRPPLASATGRRSDDRVVTQVVARESANGYEHSLAHGVGIRGQTLFAALTGSQIQRADFWQNYTRHVEPETRSCIAERSPLTRKRCTPSGSPNRFLRSSRTAGRLARSASGRGPSGRVSPMVRAPKDGSSLLPDAAASTEKRAHAHVPWGSPWGSRQRLQAPPSGLSASPQFPHRDAEAPA